MSEFNYGENDAGPHALTSVSRPEPGWRPGPQEIEYTTFNKVSFIVDTAATGKTLSYSIYYGMDNQRRKSVFKDSGQVIRTKHYFGDYERINENSTIKNYHYISSPTGLCAIFVTEGSGTQGKVWHAYTDHLGSLIYMMNADNSNDYKEYSFDAWGNPRDAADWTDTLSTPLFAGRGFTEHEHLEEFELIDMNGRIYDPMLGRFFSPDPYVQLPGYAGSYNRYSYCLNNPLIYTDPGGEFPWLAMAIFSLAGSYIGGAAAEGWEFNPGKWTWDGNTWKGIGLGALIGAAGGIGFGYGAPALAKTGFFTNFGVSGTIGAYTITGAATGSVVGYGAGFSGGMVFSDRNLNYSHQSGLFGAQLGATAGSMIGAAYGLLTPEGRDWLADMFSAQPTIDISLPEYNPYTATASLGGSSTYYQGVTQADWSDPTAVYYGTMNSFRYIYQGNENPYQPDGFWHVTDIYTNTPQPSGWNRFWGSMSGSLSVSKTYTNGVRISIVDYQYASIDHWKYNFIGGIYTPEPPPYLIIAHAPSYPSRGIISVWFDNISIYQQWIKFLNR